MSTHPVTSTARRLPRTHLTEALAKPTAFTINEVPFKTLEQPPQNTPDLGPLAAFHGTFIGRGFNTIFRPQNPVTPTDLPVPQPNSDNILELNLTVESLSFSDSLGSVPNRGEVQGDVFLNGVPYLQSISDVTDPELTTPIHLEPGLWVITPPTSHPAQSEATFARMASIPHGTTVNAQGTSFFIAGPPTIESIDITPFPIGVAPTALTRIPFPSQQVGNATTARIPQDLSAVPGITQDLLNDPNLLLRQHITGTTILSTDTIVVDTESSVVSGGGADNIAFLLGDAAGQNADAVQMSSTFWIETVQVEIEVGPLKANHSVHVSPDVPASAPIPTFEVTTSTDIGSPRTVTTTYTQIQYTQNVSLNFATLTWPHVSVATLVPALPIPVQL